MTRARLRLGQRGEALAEAHLTGLGYQLVARNYRCPAGEIDRVMRLADGTWVFVEVRARRSARFGPPEASLTPRKRQHLIAAAQTYLQAQAQDTAAWRIDVVAVELSPAGQVVRLEVFENAITG